MRYPEQVLNPQPFSREHCYLWRFLRNVLPGISNKLLTEHGSSLLYLYSRQRKKKKCTVSIFCLQMHGSFFFKRFRFLLKNFSRISAFWNCWKSFRIKELVSSSEIAAHVVNQNRFYVSKCIFKVVCLCESCSKSEQIGVTLQAREVVD